MKKHILPLLAITMIIATTIQAQIPTNGLIAYYPFNGNANDSSGNGKNGIAQNISYASDRFGHLNSCVSFPISNSSSQIDLGTSINPSQFTISIWINQSNITTTGFNVPISKYYNTNGFEIQAGKNLALIVPNGTTWSAMIDSSSRNLNKWYHVVATFNGAYAKLYLNGVQIKCLISPANTAYSDSLYQPKYSSGTNHLLIGNRPLDKGYNFHFEGNIDDIRIYNRELTFSEVKVLYHEGGYDTNSIPTNGLVAWYPFTGNTLDSSGNNNHGTNYGATLTTDRFGNKNSAYSFNGTNQRIDIPNKSILSFPNAVFSYSFWAKINPNNNGFILCKYDIINNFEYYSYSSSTQDNMDFGTLNLSGTCGPLGNNTAVSSYYSQWHHFVFIGNGTKGSNIFIDGKLIQTKSYVNCAMGTGTGKLYIGMGGGYNQQTYFSGSIDDIGLYNRALDSSEVQALYHEGGYDTNTIPTNGLVAWYPFTGNTLDSSGNNNHGTNYGATLTTDRFGKTSSAYSFNGNGNYINVLNSNTLKFNGQITISTWVKPNSLPSPVSYVLSKGADGGTPYGYEVILISNGSAQMDSWDSTGMKNGYTSSPVNSIQVNKWNHILFKYDGTYAKTYINGVLTNTSPVKNTIFSNAYDLKFGKRYISGLPYYFNGNMDDIAIYNRALDSIEIQIIYHDGGFATPTASISSFYPTIGTTNTLITIRGNSFTGSTSVTFGGIAAKSFTVINDSTIDALVGNGVSGDIVVISPNGTSTLGGFVFINSTIPTNGLVAWYPFTGNTLDSSGNNNHGTNYGATLTTDRFGNTNSAYSFQKKNKNYIKVNNTLGNFGTSDFTISLWFNVNDTSIWTSLINKRYNESWGNFWEFNQGQKFGAGFDLNETTNGTNSGGLADSGEIQKNIWYHWMIVRTGATLQFFKNGVLIKKVSTSIIHNISNTNQLVIGSIIAPISGTLCSHDGKIDDIRIYNRALNSTEVQSLYHEGGYDTISIPRNGLVAWYPFTGNTLDSSGNYNHGTNYGATLTTDRFGNVNSAYSFDGLTNYIGAKISQIPLKNSSRTISGWYKTSFGIGGDIVNYGDSEVFGFGLYSKGYLLPYPNGGYCTAAGKNPADNNWHFFVITHDGTNSNTSIYFDGLKTNYFNSVCTFPETLATIGSYFRIGNGKDRLFTGSLDDFRIYNRVLDSTEIQVLFKEGGYTGNTLPIRLATFKAEQYGNLILVNWLTSNELNNGYFIIQHSTDGSSFKDIGTVKAIGSGANSYSYTDNNPSNSINFYRLKSIDKDGSSSYSKVVSYQLSINNYQLTMFPNPAKSTVTISGSHIASVQLVDNLGRVVKFVSYKDATNPVLSVRGFTIGVYHARVQTTDGRFNNVAFIKE